MAVAVDAPDGVIVIAIVYSQPEAHVLISMLRAYGFPASPMNQGMISILPGYFVALDGIGVCVPAAATEDALALLAACDRGWSRPPHSYAANPLLNVFLGLLLFGMSGIVPPPRVRGRYSWVSA